MDTQISKNRQEDEHNRLLKIINLRLPHIFKKIGLTTAILILLFLVGYKFFASNNLLLKDVLRTLILFFLLVASLSKDAFEDEYNRYTRFQSYVIAFVCATFYCIAMPLLALVLNVLIQQITGDGIINFHKVSAFEVMFILLGFQLLFFETLKRFGREQ